MKKNVEVFGYHSYDRNFIKRGNNNNVTYGIELELEVTSELNNFDRGTYEDDNGDYRCSDCDCYEDDCECSGYFSNVDIEDNLDLFIASTDSSLTNGIEFISQPVTMGYWQRYRQDVEKFLSSLQDIESDNQDTAGFHVHIDRGIFKELQQKKLLVYLIEKFKKELTIFSRRRRQSIKRWSAFIDSSTSQTTWEFIERTDKLNDYNRYRAVNFSNNETIEIRLFKTTTDATCLYATLKLIDNIVNLALTNDIELCKATNWQDITTDKDIQNYIKSIEFDIKLLNLDKQDTLISLVKQLNDFRYSKLEYYSRHLDNTCFNDIELFYLLDNQYSKITISKTFLLDRFNLLNGIKLHLEHLSQSITNLVDNTTLETDFIFELIENLHCKINECRDNYNMQTSTSLELQLLLEEVKRCVS